MKKKHLPTTAENQVNVQAAMPLPIKINCQILQIGDERS